MGPKWKFIFFLSIPTLLQRFTNISSIVCFSTKTHNFIIYNAPPIPKYFFLLRASTKNLIFSSITTLSTKIHKYFLHYISFNENSNFPHLLWSFHKTHKYFIHYASFDKNPQFFIHNLPRDGSPQKFHLPLALCKDLQIFPNPQNAW